MSETGNQRPAGWYYAEGDPADTQRYWDGSTWQGGPQPALAATAGAPPATGMPGFGGDPSGYKGFFPTLFDFGHNSFLTPKVIRVLYVIGFVLTCLVGASYLILALATGSSGLIAAAFVFVPLITLLYLIMIRISTEFVIIAFRTYEEVRVLRADIE